jgi:hypothetical protein
MQDHMLAVVLDAPVFDCKRRLIKSTYRSSRSISIAFIPYSWAAIAAVPLPAQGSNTTPPGLPAIANSLLYRFTGFWAGWPTDSPAE